MLSHFGVVRRAGRQPRAVLIRVSRHERSRRVNKQQEVMAGVPCVACCLGTSASTDGRDLLLRWRRRRPRPRDSWPSRSSPKEAASVAISPVESAAAATREQRPALLCQQPLEALVRVHDIHSSVHFCDGLDPRASATLRRGGVRSRVDPPGVLEKDRACPPTRAAAAVEPIGPASFVFAFSGRRGGRSPRRLRPRSVSRARIAAVGTARLRPDPGQHALCFDSGPGPGLR